MDKAHFTHLQKGGELLRADKVLEAAASSSSRMGSSRAIRRS